MDAGVVDLHLLDDEAVGLEDGLLSGFVELIPGSEGRGLLDRGGIDLAALIDHGGVEELNGFLVGVDEKLADAVADVCAGVEVIGVSLAPVDQVGAAGFEGFIEGEGGEGVVAAVLEVGIVAAEPVGGGDVGDVDLDVVVGGDEEWSAPLLGLVENLCGLVEGASLDDLLAEGSDGEEQEKKRSGPEGVQVHVDHWLKYIGRGGAGIEESA